MSTLLDYVRMIPWILVFGCLPFALGIAICRALRTKEFSARLGWVLLSVFLGLFPFAVKVVQTERVGYRLNGDWVSLSDTKQETDPETGKAYRTLAATGKRLDSITLASHEVERVDGQWRLVKKSDAKAKKDKDAEDPVGEEATEDERADKTAGDKPIEVVNRTTFDLSRWKDALSFGIDLAGGTNLVYEVDQAKADAEQIKVDGELMQRLVESVIRRVNPAGTKEIVVRRLGQNRIEIILPGADQAVVEETKQQITQLGSLEFSIVANRQDHAPLIKLALSSPAKEVVIGDVVQAIWRPIAPVKGADGREKPNTDFDRDQEIAVRQIVGKPEGYKQVLILYEANPESQITGKQLKRAYPTQDSNGHIAVGFNFKPAGAYLFSNLTTKNGPRRDGTERRLAVMLNGEIFTAPSIQSTIGAFGIIQSERFTKKEVDGIVSVLNAGALPVPMKQTPINEFTISPTLGSDVQSKGKLALWVSAVAVVVFMAVYYFVAGLVADFALLLNLLFIVSIMAFGKAAFTLPGLAGLVLSAGMAVDANVLIYERMREELQRGASLRMAIHNGFDKAFAAIFDSNITSLITAVILYMIGTETVKGFAVSLFIGLVMNLFTAVYVSRLIMNILERSRLITKLKMLSIVGETHFDFVGKQFIATVASVVLIAAGLVALVARGNSNLDIDFTGGMSVTMQFNEPQDAEKVRGRLEATFNKNITVEELSSSGQIAKGTYFRLRVANEDGQNVKSEVIEDRVNAAFPGQLLRKFVTIGEPQPIADSKDRKPDDPEVPPPGTTSDRFAGGTLFPLTFSNDKAEPVEIATGTFERYLRERIAAIKVEDQLKYPTPDTLFALEGTAGPGLTAREGQVKLFTAINLKAVQAVDTDDLAQALNSIQETMKNTPVFDEVTSFEASVAGETKQSAVIATVASLLAIVAYVWFRFDNFIFGLAAVIALAHDVLVALGCVALASYVSRTPLGPLLLLTDFKINMAMIAAFLTIVGYSINDTIVIFDRLREIRGKNPKITRDMINLTLNQCLSRTILTAFTVFVTVLILYALGGEGIHGFAFCMVIGSIAGTYSTIYIATPLVLWFMKRIPSKADQRGTGRQPVTARV
ncbi:MAG: protein translocase subunit SecD [Planctomycetaceae bacterium]|nr:protein translocase subunit SecD [Planctomycetaceae bacterium]